MEHDYHLLELDQDQVARVDATLDELVVEVSDTEGNVVRSVRIPRR